ncbi:MAG: glycogen debranching protein GlgX [Thermodesulfobacteriota bacterium]|nr:glycogen debranching protein GlgX [Thermodesulfobacteriota bacterium]
MKLFSKSAGTTMPLGATIMPNGINFAVFSRHAEQVSLILFKTGEGPKIAEIVFDPEVNRTGDIWHVMVHDLNPKLRYDFRMTGPYDPLGTGHNFVPGQFLLDPYAKALTGGSKWDKQYRRREEKHKESSNIRRSCIVNDDFDWEGTRPLKIPLKDSVIYEMHVRGFTRHKSSKVKHPGTYFGVVEKIPYLKKLGITAVELMPVTEFNENENVCIDPETGKTLKNFWGYSPMAFFSPKAAFAVNGRNGKQVREFKEMVKALHKAGIEVILDIVFNHTAEGSSDGPVYSFRGIDNTIYYMLDPETREHFNFTGCGNTFNCNHPLVRNLIMDCLHYWVTEMHVDGFRFDLASVMGRDTNGEVLSNPPMLERIAEDPVLAHTKIIAEAWDASGLYQVGSFSAHPRWAEWNGKFRDDIRAFACGLDNSVGALSTRIAGSSDLYHRSSLRPYNSINFITCHDGFTLHDLVSYDRKHNLKNGEDNRDGCDHNISWNSGEEGESSNQEVLELRARRMRTLATILFISQGVPMFVAGDEFGRTQNGNNNAYCQDNEISWIDWSLAERNHDLLSFFRMLIALREKHPVFRRDDFFPDPSAKRPFKEIMWQSIHPGQPDWSPSCKTLGVFLDGRGATGKRDNDFYIMLNGDHHAQSFEAVSLSGNRRWHKIINTSAAPPADIVHESDAVVLEEKKINVAPFGAVVLISKPR